MGNSESTIKETLAQNPAHVNVKLTAVKSDRDGSVSVSRDQLMKLVVQMPDVNNLLDKSEEKTHLVIVADRSGSMAGSAWKQVQTSTVDLLESCIDRSDFKTNMIVYNEAAEVLSLTPTNYAAIIKGVAASGMTNFKAAFSKLLTVVKDAGPEFGNTIIVFMTDGRDTSNPHGVLPVILKELESNLKGLGKDIVVHSVGFTSGHDFEFLKSLCQKCGSREGMFRYCEPGDDAAALQNKLEELFDFILMGKQQIDIKLKLDGSNVFLLPGENLPTTRLQGNVSRDTNTDTGKDNVRITAETWVQLCDPACIPHLEMEMWKQLRVRHDYSLQWRAEMFSIPVVIDGFSRELLDSDADKTMWRFKVFARNVQHLIVHCGQVISTQGDVSKVQTVIEKYQQQVSRTKVFGNGITREMRQTMFEHIQDIQQNLDKVQKMIAEYMRGETSSVSMLARAHDMRYQAAFSKSRRHRLMDKRAAKNLSSAKTAQQELANLKVDQQEVMSLSQEAMGFFFCTLSQNSVKDVLLEDDIEDAIGFGLAVKRSEVVLDEPTQVWIQVISGTLVSRSAMLDALEHKINVDGHVGAHGGFTFDNMLGVTTIGTSREPINAWLPMYITKSHWDRVKVLLKPTLGTFCTLDPLGYDCKQMDVLFMVLGSMIGQLTEDSIGEHRLKILFAFQRTCTACLTDFDLSTQIAECVKKFVDSPAGRTKDIIPNLYTLIGYIVSLPVTTAREIFGPDEGTSRLNGFWLGLVTEIIRRAAGSTYKETSQAVINGLIDLMLHGTQGAAGGGKAEEAVCCSDAEMDRLVDRQSDTGNIDVPAFDPTAGMVPVNIPMKHSAKVDKAMETWAQAQLGIIRNKNQAGHVSEAKKIVKEWLEVKMEDTKDQLSDSSSGQTDEEKFNCRYVTTSVLTTVAKLLQKLTASTYPHLNSIPGCMAFVQWWLSQRSDLSEIDANSGLAPDAWVREVKEAVINIYGKLKEKKETETASTGETTASGDQMSRTAEIAVSGNHDEGQGQNSSESEIPVLTATPETDALGIPENVSAVDSSCHGNQASVQEGQSDQEPEVLVVEADVEEESVKAEGGQASGPGPSKYLDPNHANDNDNGDSDDGLFDNQYEIYSDDDDDYDGVDSGDDYGDHDTGRGKENTGQRSLRVTLPMILRLVTQETEITLVIRAVLCQAVKYQSNSQARGAITSGRLMDLGQLETVTVNAELTLSGCHKFLDEHRESVRQGLYNKALWTRANFCMSQASTVWAFIGYLMNTYKDRDEGFSDLVMTLTSPDQTDSIPYLQDKVRIMLTGKYEDSPVLANGNLWLPEKKMAKKFKDVLGDEVWAEFEVELRSSVEIHIYRASDIPNRHGHCNSNPYIPNVLRRKLGMALIPEKDRSRQPNSRRSRLRTNRTR